MQEKLPAVGGIISESKIPTNSSWRKRIALWEVLGTLNQNRLRIKASIEEVKVKRSEGHWPLVSLATSEPVSEVKPMENCGRSCRCGSPRGGGVRVNVVSYHQGRSGKHEGGTTMGSRTWPSLKTTATLNHNSSDGGMRIWNCVNGWSLKSQESLAKRHQAHRGLQ